VIRLRKLQGQQKCQGTGPGATRPARRATNFRAALGLQEPLMHQYIKRMTVPSYQIN
jgi:hypothetical protein